MTQIEKDLDALLGGPEKKSDPLWDHIDQYLHRGHHLKHIIVALIKSGHIETDKAKSKETEYRRVYDRYYRMAKRNGWVLKTHYPPKKTEDI